VVVSKQRRRLLCLSLALGLGSVSSVHAEDLRVQWHSAWPRVGTFGYVLTGVAIAGAVAVTVVPGYPSESHWSGGILFDDAVRGALRARDPGVRDAIRLASDLTLVATVLHTALFDGLLVPLGDHSAGVAEQVSSINAQAFALTTLVSTVLFKTVARARPVIADCQRDDHFDPLCTVGAYASFPSSHTSTAFTAAGLSCAHHAALPLYGGPWDLTACISSLALATATGLFRIIGDRHYATDVLLGLSMGYLYPRLRYYRGRDTPQPTAAPLKFSFGGAL
jgi:membrane-associated phospholipid phosphatase